MSACHPPARIQPAVWMELMDTAAHVLMDTQGDIVKQVTSYSYLVNYLFLCFILGSKEVCNTFEYSRDYNFLIYNRYQRVQVIPMSKYSKLCG